HGAEHKTISCYEADLPLTVENVRTCKKEHDRCGTTFMFLVMAVSIVFFSLLGLLGLDGNMWVRIGLRLLLMPVVAGLSYEILKGLAKFDNFLVRILKAPGLALQKLTTKEPDDGMIEVAIKSFTTAQELDADPSKETVTFNIDKNFTLAMTDIQNKLRKNKSCDWQADSEWIVSFVLGINRCEVKTLSTIKEEDLKKVKELVDRRAQGEPLQYILGNQTFLDADIKCDKRGLIPRFETEFMVDLVIKEMKGEEKVLDMCTGSGAIAVSIKKAHEKSCVTAVDLYEALDLAKENAERNKVEIEFIKSDMFQSLTDSYDVLVSNPPYINKKDMESLSKEVKCEPQTALFGGEDGLDFYRIIAQEGYKYLTCGGVVYLEVGKGQAGDVQKLMSENYIDVEIIRDLDGVERIVKARKR
ncbi:MAG: peptide chain release factor N(5)-glutamine methyltransferase, partial [Clostridia bacterium]|nr:peptide chain release factor N(5)-glutamine methyltransferase [Clostridia bacterium]